MTTKAAAGNASRQERSVQSATVIFNLCNEPWLKYKMSVVADNGLERSCYTSSRLKLGEVLYVETHSHRYELCFAGQRMVKKALPTSEAHEAENSERGSVDGENVLIDAFRWSRCKKIQPQTMMISMGIPLPLEHVEVLADNVEWEDINWSPTGVHIAGIEYTLARAHFMSPN